MEMASQPSPSHLGFVSRDPGQTRSFGYRLGQAVQPGDVILLRGAFGAGKTTLVQGLAAGLGVRGHVTSPSFTLINEYDGRLKLYHVDLFRLKELDVEMEQAIESCESGDGVTVIEWPDLLPADLQEGALHIDMEVLGDDDRSLIVHTEGTRWAADQMKATIEAALRSGSEGEC